LLQQSLSAVQVAAISRHEGSVTIGADSPKLIPASAKRPNIKFIGIYGRVLIAFTVFVVFTTLSSTNSPLEVIKKPNIENSDPEASGTNAKSTRLFKGITVKPLCDRTAVLL
jgi:hypothetical protein